mgnify:CR=1 FL=1
MTRDEEINKAYDKWQDDLECSERTVWQCACKWADQHPIERRTFTMEELKQFVHNHIQSKIEHNELPLVGFDMNNVENFEREFNIFENTLLEGIINGISLCEGKVEGIDW